MTGQQEIIKTLSDYFSTRSEVYGVEMAFLYGSWAGGYPRDDSDIDLSLLFLNEELTEEEIFARILSIEWELSKKLKREVNILLLTRDFRKPLLYYNAIIHGILIYAGQFEAYMALIIEALFQMEDYSLFGLEWQRELTLKNLEVLKSA
jgi:predicted nucleotidyltransferase